MEGQQLAVIVSILLWIIGYLLSAYSYTHLFSKGILPDRLRNLTTPKSVLFILIGSIILIPFLAAMMFRIGGALELNMGIAWGCYIEYVTLGSFILWLLSLLVFLIVLLITLIQPQLLSFPNRGKAILFFFSHNTYSFLLFFLTKLAIQYLSGPLSGKDASCL
jgi:hypothetical protein